jgi:hypothetical protein
MQEPCFRLPAGSLIFSLRESNTFFAGYLYFERHRVTTYRVLINCIYYRKIYAYTAAPQSYNLVIAYTETKIAK